MVAFVTRMPIGFPGRISRVDSLTIEAAPVNTTTPPLSYGIPVKLVAGKITPLAAADAATLIWGFLVAPFPTQELSITPTVNVAPTPPAFGIADVMRRGFMIVPMTGPVAAAKGAGVFVVTTAGGAFAVGMLAGSATPGSASAAVAVPTAQFTGPADANGNVEIQFNI